MRSTLAGSRPVSIRRRNPAVAAAAPSPSTRNATRGELSATSAPPSGRPIARHSGGQRFDGAHQPAVQVLRGQALDEADQRRPLQAVADPAHERGDARERQRRREREADKGDSEREDAGAEHQPQAPRRVERAKTMLASTAPAPQAVTSSAVAAVAGVQRGLRVGDLDREPAAG